MKNKLYKLVVLGFILLTTVGHVFALNFDVAVIPTELFKVCDNYFCYPETSEIMAENLIKNLNNYKYVSAIQLSTIRNQLSYNENLKSDTESMLEKYKQTDNIDFNTLDRLAKEFNVKSIILVSTYTTTDKAPVKRDLWDIFEITSAFRTTYPFSLNTSVVLTDTVNNVVMWSGKYSKVVTNSDGYFGGKNQAQAASQFEKIKDYYKNFISVSAAQNIYARFFPQEVRTFTVEHKNEADREAPQFTPNALEQLIKPRMLRELNDGYENTTDSADDFIFTF